MAHGPTWARRRDLPRSTPCRTMVSGLSMSEFKNIPVVRALPRSGEKYLTPHGFTAIKDGARAHGSAVAPAPTGKPRWLKAPFAAGAGFEAVRRTVREHRLATGCEEAKCPNIGECWNAGTPTLMLMGAGCTR